jgi:hypothetical protein
MKKEAESRKGISKHLPLFCIIVTARVFDSPLPRLFSQAILIHNGDGVALLR